MVNGFFLGTGGPRSPTVSSKRRESNYSQEIGKTEQESAWIKIIF